MSSYSNNINSKNLIVKLDGNSAYLKAKGKKEGKVDFPTGFTDELTSALGNLSKLDDSEKLRENAISNGKAIIKNWQPPTDEQIDKIFMKMKKELLA